MKNKEKTQNIVIFRPQGAKINLEVKLQSETVWLTQAQMAELFLTERSVVTKHMRNILQSKELRRNSVLHFLHILQPMGKLITLNTIT